MKNSHYTPGIVAEAMARHIPAVARTILEPAVGDGRLLQPLAELPRRRRMRLVCLDIDPTATKTVRKEYKKPFGDQLQVITEDFLSWKPGAALREWLPVDCVLMNPPFSAQKANWLHTPTEWDKEFKLLHSKIPIEIAFFIQACRFVRPEGKIITVAPESMISALSTSWFRQFLLMEGSVEQVYELRRFSFSSIESRFFILVFSRSVRRKSTLLVNNELTNPKFLSMGDMSSPLPIRFDFGFHEASIQLKEIRSKTANLDWRSLNSLADIVRGKVSAPFSKRKMPVHSNNFEEGIWIVDKRRNPQKDRHNLPAVSTRDLLLKRVGRGCLQSCGPYSGPDGLLVSDCVLRMRPKKHVSRIKLILALRVLLGTESVRRRLERGTGAAFVTEMDLSDLLVPIDIDLLLPDIYSRYETAIRKKDSGTMHVIEEKYRDSLISHLQSR